MNVGDVFIWNNFPYPKNGPIKTRWFIFLGDSYNMQGGIGIAYLLSPTKQIKKYICGERIGISYIEFKSGEYGFDKRCIIDTHHGFYNIIYIDEIENNKDIVILGTIDKKKLLEMYNGIIRKHRDISFYDLNHVRLSFKSIGITGLKV